MSCVREPSSPPSSPDLTQRTQNLPVEIKRRRFRPLRGLRNMFRKKGRHPLEEASDSKTSDVGSRTAYPGKDSEAAAMTMDATRCHSTSQLAANIQLDEEKRRSFHSNVLSVSHDSVFTPEPRMDSSSESSIYGRRSIGFPNSNMRAELFEVVRRRRPQDTSDDEDLGLPQSPISSSPNTADDAFSKNTTVNKSSQSTCSDGSLLSMGSSEMDDDSYNYHANNSAHSSRLSLPEKIPTTTTDSKSISATDGTNYSSASTTLLSHSAAKHKMAIKPKRTHGVPRKKPIIAGNPLPTTPEVNEEYHSRISSEETNFATSNSEECLFDVNSKVEIQESGEYSVSVSKSLSLPHGASLDSSGGAKLTRSTSNASPTSPSLSPSKKDGEKSLDSLLEDHRKGDSHSPSFFSRFILRQSGKKKKTVAGESPVLMRKGDSVDEAHISKKQSTEKIYLSEDKIREDELKVNTGIEMSPPQPSKVKNVSELQARNASVIREFNHILAKKVDRNREETFEEKKVHHIATDITDNYESKVVVNERTDVIEKDTRTIHICTREYRPLKSDAKFALASKMPIFSKLGYDDVEIEEKEEKKHFSEANYTTNETGNSIIRDISATEDFLYHERLREIACRENLEVKKPHRRNIQIPMIAKNEDAKYDGYESVKEMNRQKISSKKSNYSHFSTNEDFAQKLKNVSPEYADLTSRENFSSTRETESIDYYEADVFSKLETPKNHHIINNNNRVETRRSNESKTAHISSQKIATTSETILQEITDNSNNGNNVVTRRKSKEINCDGRSKEESELMKVFARRSLKLKECDLPDILQQINVRDVNIEGNSEKQELHSPVINISRNLSGTDPSHTLSVADPSHTLSGTDPSHNLSTADSSRVLFSSDSSRALPTSDSSRGSPSAAETLRVISNLETSRAITNVESTRILFSKDTSRNLSSGENSEKSSPDECEVKDIVNSCAYQRSASCSGSERDSPSLNRQSAVQRSETVSHFPDSANKFGKMDDCVNSKPFKKIQQRRDEWEKRVQLAMKTNN